MMQNVGGYDSSYDRMRALYYQSNAASSSAAKTATSTGQSSVDATSQLLDSNTVAGTAPQGSASDVTSPFQQFSTILQNMLLQMQSAAANSTSSDPSQTGTPAVDPNTAAATAGGQAASTAVDADGDHDGSTSAVGQGHHHHHHHQQTAASTDSGQGVDPSASSTLQSDVNKLVSDLFSAMNGSTNSGSASVNQANGTATQAAAAAQSPATASLLAQDFMQALTAYAPGKNTQAVPATSAVTA